MLTRSLLDQVVIFLDALRIDSTVVADDIAPPSDSQLLKYAIRVMSPFAGNQAVSDRGQNPLHRSMPVSEVPSIPNIQC